MAVAKSMFDDAMDDEVIARFLVALAEKGETASEIAGFATELLRRAVPVEAPPGAVDLCGTGGSDLPRFNVSTAAAFVVAACGVIVAKHGNRGSRRPNGSFDLLEQLGVPVELPSAMISQCLTQVGLAFVYARAYHPVMQRVVEARRIANRRTIFNLVGPLSNPAQVSLQIVGTADPRRLQVLAQALQILGRRRALVVCGEPGVDEFSVSGRSIVLEIRQGSIRVQEFQPEDIGIKPVDYAFLPTGDSRENAEVFTALLDDQAPDAISAMVALNAGAVLYLAGKETTIKNGYLQARKAIAEGKMKQKFEELRSFSSH